MLESMAKTVFKLDSCVDAIGRRTLALCNSLLQAFNKAAVFVQRCQLTNKATKMANNESEIVSLLMENVLAVKESCSEVWTDSTLLQTLVNCMVGVLDVFKDKKRAANGHLSSSIALYGDEMQKALLELYGVLAELYGIELRLR